MAVVSSASLKSLTELGEVQSFVYRQERRGERTQPCGAPVLMVRGTELFFPSLTHCFMSVRKFVIH